jgi:GNAT superfamily N-acetyltransferase
MHLVRAHEAHPDLLASCGELLDCEWPRSALGVQLGKSCDAWPIHLIAIVSDAPTAALGHGCLHRDVDRTGGVLFSLVVDQAQRGLGAGRQLLGLLEDLATAEGLQYLRLETAVPSFYLRCGYMPSSVAERECSALTRGVPLGDLQALLKKRADASSGVVRQGSERHVWLQKRLASFARSREEVGAEAVRAAYRRWHARTASGEPLDAARAAAVVVATRPLPWRRQVGPSCGLTALLCALEGIQAGAGAAGRALPASLTATVSDPSRCLFRVALSTGLSRDGEVFDAHGLGALARHSSGMATCVVNCRERSLAYVAALLESTLEGGGCALLAYDEDARADYAPCTTGGRSAHWAAIVGIERGCPPSPLVVLQHTMSRSPLVATLEELLRSNAQLRPSTNGRAAEETWITVPTRSAGEWEAWSGEDYARALDASGPQEGGKAAVGAAAEGGLAGLLLLIEGA